jgi:hypothetical protein
MRDEFVSSVKLIIAQRVNYLCSSPLCGAPTVGPKIDPEGVTNVGVAAHITAASPGGKRYNPLLSPEERKSPENGIWCCQNCGKAIDDDEIRYPEALLKDWKKGAEERALNNLGRPVFRRDDNPPLVVHTGFQGRSGAPLPGFSVDSELSHLCSLMPQKFWHPFEVRVIDSGYGALGQPYTIVGAAVNHGWDWNVSLYGAGEFGWELIASILLQGQKSWVPEAFYIPGRPGAIVVTHVHGYGTGVFRRSTSWYRIAKGEPTPFLSYPYEFHIYGWGMPFGRKLTSTHVHLPSSLSANELLTIRFDIAYSIYDELFTGGPADTLFTHTEALSFEWDASTGVFVPHTASDNPSRIEAWWGDSTEQFLKQNIFTLKHLAQFGTSRQKSFISKEFGFSPT